VLLLALESAGPVCSVALCDDHRGVLDQRADDRGPGRADRLVELIDATLDAAGVRYPDLDVIAVNHGPGSFTGVRAGVAAARALALALTRPVIAVSTLEVLAGVVGPRPAGTIVAALDARRGQVYLQLFDHRLVALAPPGAIAPEDARLDAAAPPLHLVGSGAGLLEDGLADAPALLLESAEADAAGVARRALARLAAGERPSPGPEVRPLYLRPPDARLPGLARVGAGAAASV
jgi:tRNA threonylcarbamoyladenosine biosynthesis protein TsaB